MTHTTPPQNDELKEALAEWTSAKDAAESAIAGSLKGEHFSAQQLALLMGKIEITRLRCEALMKPDQKPT